MRVRRLRVEMAHPDPQAVMEAAVRMLDLLRAFGPDAVIEVTVYRAVEEELKVEA